MKTESILGGLNQTTKFVRHLGQADMITYCAALSACGSQWLQALRLFEESDTGKPGNRRFHAVETAAEHIEAVVTLFSLEP